MGSDNYEENAYSLDLNIVSHLVVIASLVFLREMGANIKSVYCRSTYLQLWNPRSKIIQGESNLCHSG